MYMHFKSTCNPVIHVLYMYMLHGCNVLRCAKALIMSHCPVLNTPPGRQPGTGLGRGGAYQARPGGAEGAEGVEGAEWGGGERI